MKILIIEDADEALSILQNVFLNTKSDVQIVNKKEELTVLKKNSYYDIIIINVCTCWICEVELDKILKGARETNESIYLIAIVGECAEKMIKSCIELGIDKIVEKPIKKNELLFIAEKIRNNLKVLSYKKLILKLDSYEVIDNESPIDVTYREFEILRLFIENKGKIIKKDEILKKIWASKYYEIDNSSLEMSISRIRKKSFTIKENLKTKNRLGYILM